MSNIKLHTLQFQHNKTVPSGIALRRQVLVFLIVQASSKTVCAQIYI